jgi:2-methylcitrate dehydratase PrpD
MAPADVVAKLRGARDAVLAESDAGAGIDALPQWLAAASEVEAAHAAANAAAIDAAKHAAEQETGGGSSWSGPGPVPRVELEPPPPADWCDIEPDYVEYYDPFTGEPFYPCH